MKFKELTRFFNCYLPYLKDYKLQFAYSVVGMIVSASGAALSAYIIKPVLDRIFIEKNESMLYLLPFALVAIYAAKSIGKYVQIYYASYIGLDIVRRLRDELLTQFFTFEIAFFHRYRSGELISRTVNDVERIKLVVSSIIPHMLRESATIIFLLGYIIILDPWMAFLSLVFLPLTFSPLSKLAKKMRQLSHLLQEKLSDITARLSEIFNNIEMIKAHAVESHELELFKTQNSQINALSKKVVRTGELVSPMMEVAGAVAAALIIFFGGKQVIDGGMSVGSFFSFLTGLFLLYTPIKTVSRLYSSLQESFAAGERIFDMLERTPLIADGNETAPKVIQEIVLKDVSLSYGEQKALRHICLNAQKGERIALVGDSGGGKSSIINLILRFFDPDSGTVLIDGVDIRQYDQKSLRGLISVVTQRVYIINDTIAQNVCYGLQEDPQKVIECLKIAQAWEFVETMPDQIQTQINEFGTNLSGGQRQRIAIARALYRDPQILIFDEATSALDTKSEQKITDALEAVSKDKITFIIAHRFKTIEHADRILVLKEGSIVCEGSFDDLIQHCEAFRHLHGGMPKEES